MEESGQVGVPVDVRVHERVSDAGLGREMDHDVGPPLREHPLDCGTIRQLCAARREAVARLETGEAHVLQPDVVVLVEVVEPDDPLASASRRSAV